MNILDEEKVMEMLPIRSYSVAPFLGAFGLRNHCRYCGFLENCTVYRIDWAKFSIRLNSYNIFENIEKTNIEKTLDFIAYLRYKKYIVNVL
jgi:hypothetical protein